MKIRSGFVSNSSSSSFIVFNDCSIIPSIINYEKLNKKQKIRLIEQGFIDSVKDDIYLTQFISDGYESDDFDKFYLAENKKSYHDGGHGCPYDEEDYDEIDDNVWLHKGVKDENS
jgi:hypothetical protein